MTYQNKRNNRTQKYPDNEIRHGLQNNYAEYFEENKRKLLQKRT